MTVHNIDDGVMALLQQRAKADGLSINKEIKKILAEYLGVKQRNNRQANAEQFEQFLGIWSEEEQREFEATQYEFQQIDAGDWE